MSENSSIINAIIPLVTVAISVLGSLWATTISTRKEIDKMRTELNNKFSLIIQEKRLFAYTDGYRIVSNFLKLAHGFIRHETPFCRDDIEAFNKDLNEWDSKNALVMGPSIHIIYELRKTLRKFIQNGSSDEHSTLARKEALEAIIKQAKSLEGALRDEIAINAIEKHREETFGGVKASIRDTVNTSEPQAQPIS